MGESKIFSQAFGRNKTRYVAQCLLATLCILAILLTLDIIKHTVSIASLGASSFIAFAMPHRRASQPRLLVGGYLIGTVFGCLCFVASASLSGVWPSVSHVAFETIFAALAAGLAIFGMVITKTEHPPAAGLALGFVINGCDLRTIVVVMLGIIGLAVIKTLAKPLLIDLI